MGGLTLITESRLSLLQLKKDRIAKSITFLGSFSFTEVRDIIGVIFGRSYLPLTDELNESAGPSRSLLIWECAPFPFTRNLIGSKGPANFIRLPTIVNGPGPFGLV